MLKAQAAGEQHGNKAASPKKLAMLKIERLDKEGSLEEVFDKLCLTILKS